MNYRKKKEVLLMKEKWDKLLDGLVFEKLGDPLTEEEICIFENVNGIILPEDYRYLLKYVGNGITLQGTHSKFNLVGIENIKEHNDRFKMDFLFDKEYDYQNYYYTEYYKNGKNFQNLECKVAINELKYEDKKALEICKNCKYLNSCIDASWELFEEEKNIKEDSYYPWFNGTRLLLDAGIDYVYRLILTGKHKGEVWVDYWQMGYQPIKENVYEFLLAYKNGEKVLF